MRMKENFSERLGSAATGDTRHIKYVFMYRQAMGYVSPSLIPRPNTMPTYRSR